MQVSKLLKTSEGTVKFEGELSDEEHEFVLNVGLTTLLENGAIPFLATEDASSVIPPPKEVQ